MGEWRAGFVTVLQRRRSPGSTRQQLGERCLLPRRQRGGERIGAEFLLKSHPELMIEREGMTPCRVEMRGGIIGGSEQTGGVPGVAGRVTALREQP